MPWLLVVKFLLYFLCCDMLYDKASLWEMTFGWIIDSFVFALQIEKLRKQAEDQEATLLAQEEEVHGKQRELDALKEEEKKLLEDIKNSEKEIQKLSHDLEVATEINSEVSNSRIFTRKSQLLKSLIFYGNSQRLFWFE